VFCNRYPPVWCTWLLGMEAWLPWRDREGEGFGLVSLGVAPVCLRADDAIELGELLEFLGSWLDVDSDVFADALAGFCGGGGYTVGGPAG
jgi:hypothetical protein